MTRLLLLLSVVSLALGASCGRTLVHPHHTRCVFDTDCSEGLHCVNQACVDIVLPDGGPVHGSKRFGEPCGTSFECLSDYCLGGPVGAFCSQECGLFDGGACPTSYVCKSVDDPHVATDAGVEIPRVNLCATPQPLLCQACELDADCGASTGDRCLRLEGGSFCGRDCTFEACPPLYACLTQNDGRKQCSPTGKTCDCLPQTLGLKKSCRNQNDIGRCLGSQVCQLDGGFTPCDAPAATVEVCNGLDDDCSGRIDDFDAGSCSKTVNGRTCVGANVCFAASGLTCNARTPVDETCNYEDDDCNGIVDDGFRTATGLYNTLQHCGACGNDCSKLLANATTTECQRISFESAAQVCVATACAPGFFVSAGRCVSLPENLCQPCKLDVDCFGPNARCQRVDGQSVCGRDCGPGNPYGACPSGYQCSPLAGGAPQCTPVSGTCTCKSTTVGAIRTCAISTCRGYETCQAGATWSACDVASYNPEICDSKDNNCNGQTDEGFVNTATGRYDRPQHCGFCNNDCTRIFSPTLQHTTGVCNATVAMPRCEMGPCLTEVVGGTTFEWVNVNQSSADGCECRRVQGNLTVDLPDRRPSSTGQKSYVDENCDGIDGVIGDAIFVSTTAAAGGDGSRTRPFLTVAQGLAAQASQGKKYVLVAQGIYRENLLLFDGAQVFGGYSTDFLSRDPSLHTTFLEGQEPGAAAPFGTVHAEGVGSAAVDTVVAGFTVLGPDITSATPDGQAGAPSIALYVRNSGPRLVFSDNRVLAGRGGRGGRGSTGTQGFGRQSSNALNAVRGVDSVFVPGGSCNAGFNHQGGAQGVNPQCSGANGNPGGSASCPSYSLATFSGVQQPYVNPVNGNGRGGWDWSFDTASGFQCSHVTESGWPTMIQGHDGVDGAIGADGSSGGGGAGAPSKARHGSVVNGRWVPSPSGAASGLSGALGRGGGGGGAGGGVAQFFGGGCQAFEVGASGGGGAAGGCGGSGGVAGGAGGGSIALYASYTVAPAGNQLPTVVGNFFERGVGGDGGNGGFGGFGGLGGAGGFGGLASRWSSSTGGKGGEGGNGGPGGGGGGGAGGPSFALFGYNAPLSGWLTANTLITPSALQSGGEAGAGGSSPGVGSTGTAGVRGAAGDKLELSSCAAGCGAGTSCDTNGVCVPN